MKQRSLFEKPAPAVAPQPKGQRVRVIARGSKLFGREGVIAHDHGRAYSVRLDGDDAGTWFMKNEVERSE